MANIFGLEVDIPFVQNPFTNKNQGVIPGIQNPFAGSKTPFIGGGVAGFSPTIVGRASTTNTQAPVGQRLGAEVPTDNSPGPYQGTYQSSGGGGGSAAGVADPAVARYYEDQINQVNSAIGRLGNQRSIGNQNIDSQYNSALNKLLGQNAAAERDYSTGRQRTIDDNVTARAKVDDTVARQSAGLRRLLGQNSSAAQFAAPLAVAKQGTEQLANIQTGYSRNLQSLDTANEDRKRQFEDTRGDIDSQARIQRNQLEAGLAEREASLLDELSNLQVQKAQSNGQTYDAARALTQGNNNRVNSLLAQIDQLGLNPTIAAKQNIQFSAPELAQYQTSDINVAPGQSPAQTAAGQYYGLLGLDDRRKQLF